MWINRTRELLSKENSLLLRPSVVLSAIFLLVIIVNANNLDNEFLSWDDTLYVTENPRIQISDLRELSHVVDPADAYAGRFVEHFPLRDSLYALVYYFFGLDPRPYHIVQLFFHLLACLMLFLCVRQWLDCNIALMTTGLFAVHPIHVESLAWIAALKDPLFSFFLLLSFYMYWNYRARKKSPFAWYAGSIVCLVLSLACKSLGVVFPALLVVLDLAFTHRRRIRDLFIDKIPYSLTVLAALTHYVIIGRANNVIVDYPGGTPFSGFLTMVTVFARYLGKLLFPTSLSARYVIDPIHSAFEPLFVFSAMLIILLWVIAVAYFRKSPVPFFSLAWITICLLPVMNILPIPIEMADRYLYFPSIGFCLAASVLFCTVARLPGPLILRRSAVALPLVLIACFSLLSRRANEHWQNTISLWTNVLYYAPDFYIGHSNLASAYIGKGDFGKAEKHLQTSLSLNPNHPKSHHNLGELYRREGKIRQAEQSFLQAIKLAPDYSKALNSLGALYMNHGDYARARPHFEKAIQAKPNYWTAHRNLAMDCLMLDDIDCAVRNMERALKLRPHNPNFFLDLMTILARAGQPQKAMQWRAILENRFPNEPSLWLAWSSLAEQANDLDAAETGILKALSIDPNNPKAITHLDRVRTLRQK